MYKTSIVPNDAVKNTPTTGNRVCCLYRVSTNQQVDHDEKDEADIPMQRLECHKFAERMGWVIIQEEQEEGISGHKVRAENRDKIQLIKDAARQKKFDIFLVFMFDRMGQIVESGYYTGGTCPYGYKLVRQGRTNKRGHDLYDLVINEDEASLVRLIFDKYVTEGRGAQSIANLLNSMKVKNRSGNNWHPSSIRGMIKNITYIGILRSGESRSQVLPQLQIIDEQTFQAAQQITNQRSGKYEGIRHIPLNIRGTSLLAGNVFCGHCGARLSLTTNGKGKPKSDGSDTIRVRYVCQTKTRKHEPCGGQTGYTKHILDGMINDIVHEIFRKVNSLSKAEILGTSHSAKMGECKAIAKRAQREYQKAEKELQGLKQEVVKAVTGNSAFPVELLSSLVQETEQKCATLKLAYEAAQRDVEQSETIMQELQIKYDQFIDWSKIYDTANIETQKMIVAQLIERVDVFRGYELKIKFAISVEQFLIGLDISA